LADITRSLHADPGAFSQGALKTLARVSPLAAACTIEMQHRLGTSPDLRRALALEYRFTFRAQGESDFLEGIRAAIIDKDRTPKWRHADAACVPAVAVSRMLMPLGADALTFPPDLPPHIQGDTP
ncbi:MAG: enoyl-CoA hydratase/isomerase family protein, partial [Paracoccaceae bacterium]|nr:enoyl-CoA hydratase/isomerase family protein [Paracoccaceae bacterium]